MKQVEERGGGGGGGGVWCDFIVRLKLNFEQILPANLKSIS